ncbi:MAG: deoxyribodipyrimidine photo-lyase [Candidatus Competibacter sp.]|nr:deoxyribodipyrimidine photo-lyase [Candidatus Competibacter sp.]MDG4583723.1 deoxyribodipyrimidine photo-lyase [Candidatus Competibacter sp.]
MSIALVWLRRDLRLADHPALHRAATEHGCIIPVYIHAPHEDAPWEPGAASRWWLHHSLAALDRALRRRGSRLIVRRGDSLAVLRELLRETGAGAVYWNRRYEPASIARDRAVKAALREDGVRAESSRAALLVEPWTLLKPDERPFQVFTPFWKACLQRLPPAPPLPVPALPGPERWPDSLSLAALDLLPRIHWDDGLAAAWQPGEAGAQAQLERFRESALTDYRQWRDWPGRDGVSRLSPHLHFGEIGPRQIWATAAGATDGDPLGNQGAETYLREIGWREFAHYVLYHWPHTPEQPLRERFAAYPWREEYTDLLRAWQRGRTGYPMVDAGMRQLWRTGWMHNRVRMLAASFLVKNCRIPWREGARWFWDTLVDADLASNTLGWQWTAGCGTDAAPYFRIFNPIRQGEQFDPDGAYVRRWVPELAKLPAPILHQPWMLSAAEQQAKGFTPGLNYPNPVVDFAASRAEALAGYQRIKNP